MEVDPATNPSEARGPEALAGLDTASWVAGLVHDLRTPLQGIIGMTEVVLRGELDVWARSCLATSLDSARSLEGIVNGLLDLIRLDSGSLKLSPERFWMEELLAHSVRSVLHRAHEGDVQVELSIDPSAEREFVGDALRIRQCLVNLLGNAVKFAEGGRVELSVTAPDGGRVRLAVRDDGIGMDAEQLGRVFQPFEQATERTSGRFGGSGMGLTITRSLVELMGGTIHAQSRLGEGSCFTLELPLEVLPDAALAPVEGSLARALVVMPEGPGRRVVERSLAERSIICGASDDLPSLFESGDCASFAPQLVLVDHRELEAAPGRLADWVATLEPRPMVAVVGRVDAGVDLRTDWVDHAIVH
ncbi:MAG: HAMP domain-containing sensor histidine kinase, partial [Planctomycetota bacterium]